MRADAAALKVRIEGVESECHGTREVSDVGRAALAVALRVQRLLERLEVAHPLHCVSVVHYVCLEREIRSGYGPWNEKYAAIHSDNTNT